MARKGISLTFTHSCFSKAGQTIDCHPFGQIRSDGGVRCFVTHLHPCAMYLRFSERTWNSARHLAGSMARIGSARRLEGAGPTDQRERCQSLPTPFGDRSMPKGFPSNKRPPHATSNTSPWRWQVAVAEGSYEKKLLSRLVRVT